MKQKHLKYVRIAAAAVMFVLFAAVAVGFRPLDAILVTQFGPGLLRLTSGLFLGTLAAVLLYFRDELGGLIVSGRSLLLRWCLAIRDYR